MEPYVIVCSRYFSDDDGERLMQDFQGLADRAVAAYEKPGRLIEPEILLDVIMRQAAYRR